MGSLNIIAKCREHLCGVHMTMLQSLLLVASVSCVASESTQKLELHRLLRAEKAAEKEPKRRGHVFNYVTKKWCRLMRAMQTFIARHSFETNKKKKFASNAGRSEE